MELHGREAPRASATWNVCKTLGQTVVFWGLFLFVFPNAIVRLETHFGLDGYQFPATWAVVLGIVLFTLGGTLGLRTGLLVAVRGEGTPMPQDCPRVLVVTGPYRYVRNPMAIAGLTQGVAVGLILGSPGVVLYALAGGPVWHFFVRPWEEADLEHRFGAAYNAYRQHVRCWWPRRG
jgi:protein-S-isoprenylcysteine O-methyltransferase Ste14